ncbi:hydrogen gas-evolving membrane-bound hydrogenase subunit E [Microcella sp.]|uniref:hydrogen gas-evolving membrane-bound hydrogenase subunit E n=1 Tax=Microcella sp. TaxID=1913979 RepID=UPI0025E56A4A|nr:hydrogen gas-evolving membrane-bound hydrogenase subunit E [Microcella sp.]
MLTALLVATLAVVVITMVATVVIGRNAGWIAAAGLAVLATLVGLRLPELLDGPGVVREVVPWMPTLDVALRLRLDGLAALFLLIVLGIGALVMAYSARYLSDMTVHRHTGYFAWMLLFAFSMTGLVLADDLVLLFVFWELTTLCSFFLINRSGRRASAPAVRTLLVTAMGGLALLFAVVLIVARTGTTVVSDALQSDAWQTDSGFTAAVAVLIALAAMTKSAQFPFHMWLPDAMVAPTPVSAYLHAAAMVKAGIYLLMLFSPALAATVVWQSILVTSGLITAIMGAVFALRRFDLKEIMAYSTVSQLGFIVALIGIGTPSALATAALYTLAHALFKSALFMVVGIVDQRAGSRDIRLLRGLRRTMPVTFVVTVLAGLSMAGVFPLLGFISKEYLLGQMIEPGGPAWLGILLAATAVIGATATFAYTGRILLGGFTDYRGSERVDDDLDTHRMPQYVSEAGPGIIVPALLPALLGLVLGPAVVWLHPLIGAAGGAAAGISYSATFALFGGLTVELALSITIIALGLVTISRRRALDRLFERRILPFTAIDVVERIRTGLISLGSRVGDLTRTDAQPVHLATPWALLGVVALAAIAIAPALGEIVEPGEPWTDALLLALLLATVVPAVITRSRLTALILVGGAGFVVALWFFALGAIDVGLTQLLVELLTVVALVLILRRLPAVFHRVTRSRQFITATIALAVGALATVVTLAFTGRRDISAAGQYFLDEAYTDTGGTNIVNTILVDYRALDTFGELTVIAVAGIVLMGVLAARPILPERTPDMRAWAGTALLREADNTLPIRVVARWAAPVIIVLSIYLLLRGHYEPGGGFIAALVGGTGFALAYLGASSDRRAPVRWPYRALLSAGVVVGVVSGIGGYLVGSFLKPVRIDIPLPWGDEYGFTSALIFDLGVYFAVVAIIIAVLNELGGVRDRPGEVSERAGSRDQEVAR